MTAGYHSERLGNHTYTIIPDSHNAVLFINIYLKKIWKAQSQQVVSGALTKQT